MCLCEGKCECPDGIEAKPPMSAGRLKRLVSFWNRKTIRAGSIDEVIQKAKPMLASGKWRVLKPVYVHFLLDFAIKMEREN
jgi:hypothetical protein